eukprot:snap_masked-scaffold_2-processed-gene-11.7-mRNA-1 protein AED:0.14 eAED:1.00 QI:0/-1/0/1/-1/1/1/0/236
MFEYEDEEKLRDETLEKLIQYAEENDIIFSPSDVLSFDVMRRSRIDNCCRTLPLLTHQFVRFAEFSDWFYVLLGFFFFLICIIIDIVLHSVGLLLFTFLCIPYFYFHDFLYYFSFDLQAEEHELLNYLRQNIIVTKGGIFIYLRNLQQKATFDFNYSPIISFLVWIKLLKENDFEIFIPLPEEFIYINIAQIRYANYTGEVFKSHMFFIQGENNYIFPITATIRQIIEEAKKNYQV